ncbi:MAG: hypothetical protein AAF456_21645, partial [Planctomycetota bacterium]
MNDEQIDSILAQQQTDVEHPFHGGFEGTYALYPVGKAAWFLNRMVCGLVSNGSRHCNSTEVLDASEIAARLIRRLQHDDGTIDLSSTNFCSPPDTAFVVEPLALTAGILRAVNPAHESLLQPIGEFLVAAGEALISGGIHTPNHRWVVCMALARINNLFPDPRLVERADQ